MLIRKIKLPLITASMLAFFTTFAQFKEQFSPNGFTKIEEGLSGFTANLDSGDRFSRDHDVIGDVDGDGVLDLVIGARSDDDGETDAGAVYILFMNPDATVKSNQKISMTEGGFTDTLSEGSFFGYGVAGVGDYDGDNIPDIAVTANSVPTNSIYIIHLNRDGTVKDFVKNENINTQGLSAIGDLNDDGKIDLVACSSGSSDGGTQRGSIEILFFNDNSRVITRDIVRISSTEGGFGEGLADGDRFGGREVAMLGDIDGDGTKELAVGAFMSNEGKGAIWILSLDNTTYNVVSKQKITEGIGGFTDVLTTDANPNGTSGANLGHAMCAVGDLNGDGIPDLITGANQQDEGWLYILYLNEDKTVKSYNKINNAGGGFDLALEAEERFSRSISCIGDLKGDGSISLNVGGGAGGTGTLYILNFEPCGFDEEPGFNRWANGNILYSNWDHPSQTVIGEGPISYEQCTFKVFETEADVMTYNFNDGRCICMDNTANLTESSELSTAFTKNCEGETTTPVCNAYETFSKIEVEDYCTQSGIQTEDSSEGTKNVGRIENGDWIMFESVDLTNTKSINARVASNQDESFIEVRLDNPEGTLIGTLTVYNTGDNQEWETVQGTIEDTPGEHKLYLVFKGGDGFLFNINWIQFVSNAVLSNEEFDKQINQLVIYPNPVVSKTTIENAANSTVTIYAMDSSVLLTQTISSERGSIDLSGIATGIYFAEVKGATSLEVIKLVKN